MKQFCCGVKISDTNCVMEQETKFVFHFPTLEGEEIMRGGKEVLASAGSVWHYFEPSSDRGGAR